MEEALITDADVLYVSMRANGETQTGYARYLCEVLHQHQTKTKFVKIVEYSTTDTSSTTSAAYGVLADESYYPDWIVGFDKPKTDN